MLVSREAQLILCLRAMVCVEIALSQGRAPVMKRSTQQDSFIAMLLILVLLGAVGAGMFLLGYESGYMKGYFTAIGPASR
jgi:hypothetical protein